MAKRRATRARSNTQTSCGECHPPAQADPVEQFSEMSESNPLVTITEAARMFRKSHQTVARWLKDGLMEYEGPLPGGTFGIRLSEIKKFIGGSALQEFANTQEPGRNGDSNTSE